MTSLPVLHESVTDTSCGRCQHQFSGYTEPDPHDDEDDGEDWLVCLHEAFKDPETGKHPRLDHGRLYACVRAYDYQAPT